MLEAHYCLKRHFLPVDLTLYDDELNLEQGTQSDVDYQHIFVHYSSPQGALPSLFSNCLCPTQC